ncbi:hypothetical protein C3L33_11749, partial [Rhododendron williamsianum]
MDTELYMAAKEAKEGDLSYLSGIDRRNITEEEAMSIEDGYFLQRTQHGNNNILHIAARAGRDTFVGEALRRFPFLSDQVNSQGDTPLLVAARFGHLQVVKTLAATARENETNSVVARVEEIWKKGKLDVARYLLGLKPEMATFDNLAGESPLFLAAESRCERFMEDILWTGRPYSTKGPDGLNALHASRHCCGTIISELIKQNTDLLRKKDDHGKAAIHHAVEADYWVLLDQMLDEDPSIALFPDVEGYTALLRASSRGCWKICEKILRVCPESIEARVCPESIEARECLRLFKALNVKGQHALHLANGRNMGKIPPEIWELLNVGDDEGNTPLHLAVEQNHYEKAILLTSSASIYLGAVNKEGLTALDLCESDWQHMNSKVWVVKGGQNTIQNGEPVQVTSTPSTAVPEAVLEPIDSVISQEDQFDQCEEGPGISPFR